MIRWLGCVDRELGVAALAACLGGCTFNTATVVLLPEKDGRDAAVTVKARRPGSRACRALCRRQRSPFGPYAYAASPQEVDTRFGAALARATRPVRSRSRCISSLARTNSPPSQANTRDGFRRDRKAPRRTSWWSGIPTGSGRRGQRCPVAAPRRGCSYGACPPRHLCGRRREVVRRGKREPARGSTADGVAEPRNRRGRNRRALIFQTGRFRPLATKPGVRFKPLAAGARA